MKVLLVILACTLTAFAQKQPIKPCSLTLEQSPVVRGLKLGQEYGALSDILPRGRYGRTEKPDEIGEISPLFTAASVSDRNLLKGISLLRLSYIDNRLEAISIYYDSSVEWESDLHFTSAIAEQLHLPTKGWIPSEIGLRLVCDGFFVETRDTQWLVMERSGYREEMAKRRATLEQKKRAEFKP